LLGDELLDPPITQVVSINETKSDSGDGDSDNNDDEVIPASYSPKANTFI
jgi:hypothetical protein